MPVLIDLIVDLAKNLPIASPSRFDICAPSNARSKVTTREPSTWLHPSLPSASIIDAALSVRRCRNWSLQNFGISSRDRSSYDTWR